MKKDREKEIRSAHHNVTDGNRVNAYRLNREIGICVDAIPELITANISRGAEIATLKEDNGQLREQKHLLEVDNETLTKRESAWRKICADNIRANDTLRAHAKTIEVAMGEARSFLVAHLGFGVEDPKVANGIQILIDQQDIKIRQLQKEKQTMKDELLEILNRKPEKAEK